MRNANDVVPCASAVDLTTRVATRIGTGIRYLGKMALLTEKTLAAYSLRHELISSIVRGIISIVTASVAQRLVTGAPN